MNDKMKADFDSAFYKKFGFGRMMASANADAAQMFEAAEWAWQVSRSAIEVELPKGGNMWGDEPVDISRSDAVKAIKSLGLKVKP